ncbi:hypothetical protein F0562_012903 [Nyssa sinensis]|uniref:MSP domain-containing protein n=1 Tax=Nyssa sinensis TaxID=561372 RepID=A0A5J4ZV54_9ASTE|nr:hypothetical protein F0562_012903 [Nyssa sinensis]
MSTGELLNIEPLELKFPFELKKQISCSLQLSNKTENHVAFKVKTTNPKKYCVRPNTGIVLPRSTCDIIVTMQAQKEAPPDMQCKDKFLLQSAEAGPGTTPKDITPEMFNKEAGRVVEECKLRVIYVSPPLPPSPVAEGSEEGSSPRVSLTENGNLNGSEVTRAFVEAHDKSSEVRALISKLTEEKATAIQGSNKLRQELELLTRNSNKSRGGVSFVFVIIVGLLGIVLGYDSPVIVQGAPQVFKMENPFQSVGPGNAVEVNEVKNGTLVRLVLPGVGENGIKVWTENNTVFFAGEGEIEWEGDDCRRKYGGSLEFHPEEYRADGVKAEMKNGILRLLVPNAEAKEKKEGK